MHSGCSTCACLTAAVVAMPDDDLPRLQFADHLDGEHADAISGERATFIRRQIDLALRGNQSHAVKLTTRENLNHWVGDLPASGLPEHGTVWRRGFVEQIACPWEEWQRYSHRLQAETPLRHVAFTTWPRLSSTQCDDLVDQADVLAALIRHWPALSFTLPRPPLAHLLLAARHASS